MKKTCFVSKLIKSIKSFDIRGSAIIVALITMCVLILLGGAVAILSSGTLNVNTADAQTNDAFYAADSSVNSAIEQIKYEASSYYNEMLAASGEAYISLYNSFFYRRQHQRAAEFRGTVHQRRKYCHNIFHRHI